MPTLKKSEGKKITAYTMPLLSYPEVFAQLLKDILG